MIVAVVWNFNLKLKLDDSTTIHGDSDTVAGLIIVTDVIEMACWTVHYCDQDLLYTRVLVGTRM